LDDGRVTDSHGRTVSFKNTVIIMTSNIGSAYLLEGITAAGDIREEARKSVMNELKSGFRPEFLNRVDDIVLFKPLHIDEVMKIAALLAEQLKQRLKDQRITLEISDEALKFIAKAGYDPVYGARPLKRYLQRELETRVARAIIAGTVLEGGTLTVELVNGALCIKS
jgi:ATP-dependent Clp protease ATP-binding subunit ClpB